MNKSFKTLFTLFLGILLIIPTFTANSIESLGEQLIKLEGLYERGAITKEEFTKAKTILLKIDTQASEKIDKAKEKIIKQKKEEERAALITNLESDVNQTKSYTNTGVKKYASNAKDKWEKTEFFFDDFRVYAHRPGAIKIKRISDGKQVAVFTKNYKIKYYNDGEGLFETEKFKENTLEKNSTLEELVPLIGFVNEASKKLEKALNMATGRKELPGKMNIKYNGATFLSWERMFVPAHQAQFYQMLALDEQPFHFYIVHPKGEFALNMAKFVHKIDIAVAEVKKELQEEYNLTPEEMDRILKQRKDNLDRQLAAISKETSKAIEQETGKAIESEVRSEVASAVDTELAKELEAAVGAAMAEEFISAVEEASGQAIDRALTAEMAIEIDRAIAEAVSEGISAAAAEAGIKAGLAVLAAGGTEQEATDACSAAAGTAC